MRWFRDSSLVDLHAARGRIQQEYCIPTQNGFVKEFVAAHCWLSQQSDQDETGITHRLCFLSDICSDRSRCGLSRNDDSNMACEAYRADAFVKHL